MKRWFAVIIFALLFTATADAGCRHVLLKEAKPPFEWANLAVTEEVLSSFESEMERVVRAATDEELRAEVEGAIGRHFKRHPPGQGYLPGLTPEWNLAGFDDLVADIPEANRALGGSRYGNYLGNISQIALMNRYLIKKQKGDRLMHIRDYFEFWMEAEYLRELLRRKAPTLH